ncbi:MAG: Nramp family divalent metal transporter [Planctomycetaceae bacterium]|nr:Nramp family divalent metal transporter [Planctomycetaceae bacterium]
MPDPSETVNFTTAGTADVTRDHGCLPDWQTGDLPEPLPFTLRNILRTIGPGAILLAGSIGGGEWIAGPMVAVNYGSGILWIASVAIFLQMIFNLEAIRYTLYSGEPIVTGIMRLTPGSRFWAAFYIVMGVIQLATPAMALGCANVLFAAAANREPVAADSTVLLWISYFIMACTVLVLLSGKSIEKVLERLSWAMVLFIFSFLIVANVLFVPLEVWIRTATGFLMPQPLPADVDVMLLAVFAATAGSGGLGNLAISNLSRDKGLGMGAWMGSFGGVLASDHAELATIGRVFRVTSENLRRWSIWWKYSLLDQTVLWGMGCVLGMFLNVNLAVSIVPTGTKLPGYSAGAFQAQYMAEHLWHGFWALCLVNGFWILFSTQLGNIDVLTRIVADIGWSGWPRLQKMASSRLYARLLLGFATLGIVVLSFGENALSLFKVLGVFAGPILTIGAFQILRINTRFLPQEIHPPMWRRFALVACGLFYGAISIASLLSLFMDKT